MSNDQLLILTNAALVAILGFFIRMWIGDLKASISDLKDKKMDVSACDMHHKEISAQLHRHGTLGTAGEVIK